MARLSETDHAPTQTLPAERYARAERFLPWNAARLTFGMGIDPQWIDGGDGFWFRSQTAGGPRYRRVEEGGDAVQQAFDHVRLAAALSRAMAASVDPDHLDLQDLMFQHAPERVTFTSSGRSWPYDVGDDTCTPTESPSEASPDVVRSPDGTWEAFVRDHNLWLRAVQDGTERQLTHDGEPGNGYGATLPSPLSSAGLAEPDPPVVHWSPDSRRFLSCRIDERPAKHLHLVQSVPKDGATRPRLHSYAYPLPGDAELPLTEAWCFAVDDDAGVKVQRPPLPTMYYGAPFQDSSLWWTADGSHLFLLLRERAGRSYELIAIDPSTARSGASSPSGPTAASTPISTGPTSTSVSSATAPRSSGTPSATAGATSTSTTLRPVPRSGS